MRLKCAVNLSVIACAATRTSSKTRRLHRAEHYLQWHSTERITVCVAVYLCLDAESDNTIKAGDWYSDSVALSAFISLTTHFSVSSPKSFYTSLNVGKWHHPTDGSALGLRPRRCQDLFQKAGPTLSLLLLLYLFCAPAQIEKQNTQQHANACGAMRAPAMIGVSFVSLRNVIRKGQMKTLWRRCYGNYFAS